MLGTLRKMVTFFYQHKILVLNFMLVVQHRKNYRCLCFNLISKDITK